jgi:GTP cyclohydrolase I
MMRGQAEEIAMTLIKGIGDDPARPGLRDTPVRVSRMWKELFFGYDVHQKPHLTIFPNDADGVAYDQMVIDAGKFYSHCEHHLVPFFGTYHFAYIPNKKILGLSKVSRLVDYHAARLQIQERLAKDVLDDIEKALDPRGVALVLQARHLCKEMRGVRKQGTMVTSDMRGCFRTRDRTRAEFLKFVNQTD